ncbi:glycosyltransferase family 2 protein [Devosia beringensis]|uniref:glycosyltransferase family 2 protein n=1 Tax=Devosia beringensis TaxID=2657486 RepID=UPI00186B626D|nr:glycosyltransferase [Devosia beringensis]
MPIYRRTAYIGGALASCFAQSNQDFEVIVHDDTENDSVRKIVESFASPKIRYIHNNPALGMLEKVADFQTRVRTEWMVYLCDDDLLEPDYIASVARHIAANPDAALIRSRHQLITQEGQPLRLDALTPYRSTAAEFMVQMFKPDAKTFRTNLTGVAFRTVALQAVGKDIFNMRHSDRVLYAITALGGSVICDENVLVKLRVHGGSISGKLDPDFRVAVDEALALKRVMDRVFATLRERAQVPEERATIADGVTQFNGYFRRSIQRAIDNGLLALLKTKRGSVRHDFGEAKAVLNENEVPTFPTLHIYELAMNLPFSVRSVAMDLLRTLKLRKRGG